MAAPKLKGQKEHLIQLVSASMIQEPSFKSSTGEGEVSLAGQIASVVHQITSLDAEFVLKLALYVRDDLGIRGTANFLVSLCAFERAAQPFLEAYLSKIVNLPSDWLQIATFARDSPLRKTVGLPSSLRAALASHFTKFNEFSLAKYNKEGAQKAKAKRAEARVARGSEDEEEEKKAPPYTFKQMIRTLHIGAPHYYVMCLLGKRYPATLEEFQQCGLDREGQIFDKSRAGHRMRLAVPVTWETELASKGNKAAVWEALIANRQLPFMAMLRNLRNIIIAGCSRETHNSVLTRLTNEEQVANSRQFPYRFFSAYDALNINLDTVYTEPPPQRGGRGGGRGGRGGRGAARGKAAKPPPMPEKPPTSALLGEYREAIDKAVQISTALNLRPIHGKTIVAVAVCPEMNEGVRAKGSKGIGSVRTMLDVGALLGLMFKFSCEACDFLLFSKNAHRCVDFDVRKFGILKAMTNVLELARSMMSGGENEEEQSEQEPAFPYTELDGVIERRQAINAVVVIDCAMREYGPSSTAPCRGDLQAYLQKMRRLVNPDLLFVHVDINGATGYDPTDTTQFSHPNDICMTGFSDNILRFVAERGEGGPLRYIERINEVKGVDTSHVVRNADFIEIEQQLPAVEGDDETEVEVSEDESETSVPRQAVSTYKDIRFFISSTFVDMQSERNALVRDVFPAIRRMCLLRNVKANIIDIDFRWGITHEDAVKSLSLSICLNEVARCKSHLLCMVGSRYGYCPPNYDVAADADVDASEFAHLSALPKDLSVTELEIRQALDSVTRNESDAILAFLRDNDETVKSVPKQFSSLFAAEQPDAATKVKALRNYLKEQSQEARLVHAYKYRAPFLRLEDRSKPVLDMEEFRSKALKAVWSCILQECAIELEEEQADAPVQEGEANAPALSPEVQRAEDEQRNYLDQNARVFAGRRELLKSIVAFTAGHGMTMPLSSDRDGEKEKAHESNNVVALVGSEGCGKSSLMAAVATTLAKGHDTTVFAHFFDVGDGMASMAVLRVAHFLVSRLGLDGFNLSSDADEVAKLLPAIYEAASRQTRLVILLDGPDSCTTPQALMSFLSYLIPNSPPVNCYFVVALRDASNYLPPLRARKPPVSTVPIPQMPLAERAELVRKHLKVIGKKFQEVTSYGNQLKPLLRKADSGKPVYLMQVLTYLRLFSTFDTIDIDIRNMAPTCSQLHMETMKKFEQLFGYDVCCPVLVALLLTSPVGGIAEVDLYRQASVSGVRRLLTILESFVTCHNGAVQLTSPSLMASIRKRYIQRSSDEVDAHNRLCSSTLALVTAAGRVDYTMLSPRQLVCVTHHAFWGKSYNVIYDVTVSVECLESVVRGCLLPALLNTVAALATVERFVYRKLEPFAKFLILHRHILVRHPSLLLQSALNMPKESVVYQAALPLSRNVAQYMRWDNRDRHGEKECTQTMLSSQAVLCVAFNDKADLVAIGGKDMTCRVVKVYDGTTLFKLPHPNDVTAALFFGKYIATGCEDGQLRIWSLLDGSLVQEGTGHTRRINCIAFQAKHADLFTASDDCTARLWPTNISRKEIRPFRTFRKHTGPVTCCDVHSNSIVHATGSWDGTVFFWLGDKEKRFEPNRGAIRSIAFIPSMVVTTACATYGGEVMLFDLASEQLTATFNNHLGFPITRITYSADAKKMATCDARGAVKLWRASVTGEVLGTLVGHHAAVESVIFYPQNNLQLATASRDASVRHWHTNDEACGALHGSSVTCVAAARSGKFFVTGSFEGLSHYVDIADSLRIKFTAKHDCPVLCVAIAPSETSFATTGLDGFLYVWRAEAGVGGRDGSLLTKYQVSTYPVYALTCKPESGSYVAVSMDGACCVATCDAPVQITSTFSAPQKREVLCAAPSANGVLRSGMGGCVDEVNFNDGTTNDVDGTVDWALCMATSPDGKYLAVGEYSGGLTIHILNGDCEVDSNGSNAESSLIQLTDDLKRDGRSTAIHAACFLSNNELCVACDDTTLRVFFVDGLAIFFRQIFHATAPLKAVSCCPKTRFIVCGDALGNVYAIKSVVAAQSSPDGTVEADMLGEAAPEEQQMGANAAMEALRTFSTEAEELSSIVSDKSEEAVRPTEKEAAVEDNSRFAMITQDVPTEIKGQQRREWLMQRQRILVEAMKLSKTNPVARMAMRCYSQKTMQMYSAYKAICR